MDDKTFLNGRHRGKTYSYVRENDKEFCDMVLRGESSRFIPQDFLQYLINKGMHLQYGDSVEERCDKYFIKALSKEIKTELIEMIGQKGENMKIEEQQVHQLCNDPTPNGFLGVFYQFFIQKHISNVIDTNANRKFIDNCTSIFPFPVSNELTVNYEDAEILEKIQNDQLFTNNMREFLNKHFRQVELSSISKKFFANVLNCKNNNIAVRRLSKALQGMNLNGMVMSNETEDMSCDDVQVKDNQRNDYLANYPRFNYRGTKRYLQMYEMFKDISNLCGRSCDISRDKYKQKYLQKLPEINFYELYSLLDVEFFNGHRSDYEYLFKKYLFFFINALVSESKPVFFIDDVLYQCLLHYGAFKTSRQDVLELKYELSLLVLVYLKKIHKFDYSETYDPNNDNLQSVKSYFDRFSNLAGVSVGREICTEVLEAQVTVCTNQIVMDVCYRRVTRNNITAFLPMLLQAALLPEDIKRLVIYNAYTGLETSIEMPENKESVVEFIRKYNKYDFSTKLAPEKFLTWGHEDYYEGDVANWDSKLGFNI